MGANSESQSRSMFGRPTNDPYSRDDRRSYPLDGIDITKVSDEELAKIYLTAPMICGYSQSRKIVRLSRTLALKGGTFMLPEEGRTQQFAAEITSIPVPKVHRIFCGKVRLPSQPYREQTLWFMVMDFVSGRSVAELWDTLDEKQKDALAMEVAQMIDLMQATPLNYLPPGPIGGSKQPWNGPWFTDYGAGPFNSLQELEAWCNHKLDVCLQLKQAKKDTPRFHFKDVVLTHLDITPRNLILNEESGKLWLVDWEFAGIYPKGFERAVLARQHADKCDLEFGEMVISKLTSGGEKETLQLGAIMYGLTTGAFL